MNKQVSDASICLTSECESACYEDINEKDKINHPYKIKTNIITSNMHGHGLFVSQKARPWRKRPYL
jgi:hypothetical protein